MRTLYLDLAMGAAGDMLTAALLELLPEEEQKRFLEEFNALGIPGVRTERENVKRCGISGTHITVKVDGVEEGDGDGHEDHDHHCHSHEHDHDHDHGHDHEHDHDHDHEDHDHGHHHHDCEEHDHDHEDHEHHHDHEGHDHGHDHGHHHHHHSGMHDISHVVEALPVPERVKKDVLAVYGLIADAESRVHGVPVTEIHFHEVGAMDAVADVTAVCLLMERLAPDRVAASPVHVGSGQVRCAHGIMPVPAPATAELLKGIPMYGGRIRGELCTPTGAALVRYFADRFGDMPVMEAERIGYGMGRKEFEAANCVRAVIGTEEDRGQKVVELRFNVDDMTGEEISFAAERIFEAGALEVFTTPVMMKKSRPGLLVTVLFEEESREKVLEAVFRNTSTIGVREVETRRTVLKRTERSMETSFGTVREKVSEGFGAVRRKFEFDDVARIAREQDMELRAVRRVLEGQE